VKSFDFCQIYANLNLWITTRKEVPMIIGKQEQLVKVSSEVTI